MIRHATVIALVLLVAGPPLACRPSASVERTTPIADLRIYRTVAVRVAAAPEASNNVVALEQAIAAKIGTQCSFEDIKLGGDTTGADLLVDVNIQRAGRGGEGFLQNPNKAFMNAIVVLSDGIDGELVGSAVVKGESSAILVDGTSPEDQAVEVVASSVAEILTRSGCEGARLARPAPPPASDAGPVVAIGQDGGPLPEPSDGDARRATAEAANEEGKRLFRAAQIAEALAQFEKAQGLVSDPRYGFNVCLAHEALEQFDRALKACEEVRRMNPPASLATKVDQRIAIIRDHL